MESAPLVSCIMPTSNRRAFVPAALHYFLRQDYPNKELLVVDDGSDRVEDLLPADVRVRYIRLNKRLTLGEKRNFCVRESRGDLIMHWDDDDWIAPYRISYQVRELLSSKVEVCGLQQMLYRELGTGRCWLYTYPANAQPWIAGNSLLYSRDFWKKRLFPDIQVASDTRFIFEHPLTSYRALADFQFYVASIHGENTSPKNTKSMLWHPLENEVVKNIMGAEWLAAGVPGPQLVAEPRPIVQKVATGQGRATACLLSYKRPHNMQQIVDSLGKCPFIDEILLWNNNPDIQLTVHGPKVRIIQSPENMICYGRFLCALQARNQIIYFQDDDALVGNVNELYQNFLNEPARITYALSDRHYAIRDGYDYPNTQVCFLGWGSFIQKDWISVLDDYLKVNERDYLFLREADKFFTLLLGKRNHTMTAKIQLLEHDSTPGYALYLENSHALWVALAIRKALAFNRLIRNMIPITWNIVISSRNYGCFLKDAVNSVLYSHADYIITIVDDCSSDDTQTIGEEFARNYSFIHYLRNEKQMGAGYTRNRGVASSDSIFVILLDADDKIGDKYVFEAEKLLRQGFDVVNPDAILFGDIVTRWPVPETVSLEMQLSRNHVHCCSGFRRSYWAQVGGIDEAMICWEDYEFWIRLAEAGARIVKIPGDHFYYRKHGVCRSSINEEHNFGQNYIQAKHRQLYKKKSET